MAGKDWNFPYPKQSPASKNQINLFIFAGVHPLKSWWVSSAEFPIIKKWTGFCWCNLILCYSYLPSSKTADHHRKHRNADLDALGLTPLQYYIITMITLITYSVHLAVNPIIYSIIDSKWRQDFIALLCKAVARLPIWCRRLRCGGGKEIFEPARERTGTYCVSQETGMWTLFYKKLVVISLGQR